MKIKILGTRGEIEETLPRHSKHSGVLINDELLLDVGEKEFLKYSPKWILITHFHPDHAYFFRRGQEENPSTKAEIYAPEKPSSKLITFPIKILDKEIQLGPNLITPIPTHHSKNVKSQAYVIKSENKSILYTGDLVWIDKKYHELFASVDLIITDGSYIRKGGLIRKDPTTQTLYGHNGIPNLIDLFKSHTQNIIFIHFGAWFYKDTKNSQQKIKSLGKERNVKAKAAHDGLEVEI